MTPNAVMTMIFEWYWVAITAVVLIGVLYQVTGWFFPAVRRTAHRENRRKLLSFFLVHDHSEFSGGELYLGTNINSGELYALLSKLENEGIVSARWEVLDPGERPRRRFYRLSNKGVGIAVGELK